MMNITSNKLKIIAILCMIIDHFGYYFYDLLNEDVYYICRIIGRIAMPIFVFLIVKGYFNTKDLKRYMIRIFRLGMWTQIAISLLMIINFKYVSSYTISIYTFLNILFSFNLILIFIYSIENILKNEKRIVSLILLIGVILAYYFIPIDYGFLTLILALVFYIAEKINKKLISKLLICLGMFLTISVFTLNFGFIQIFSILALPIILLYNNNLGKKSVKIQKSFYNIFLIQHVVLYSLVLIIYYFNF